ncbi:MAG: putative bifunctional diguanylate cyclase/phosphodiesterase [Leptothrix sp. (in: b-proteobacteria)]
MPAAAVATPTEVAELRLALQRALRRADDAENRLHLTLAAAGKSAWSWTRLTDLLCFDDLELDGRRVPWPPMTPQQFADRVHPDDAAAVRRVWQLTQRGVQADHDLSFRLDFEGQLIWVRMRGQVLERDRAGRVLRATGTLKDTTAQQHLDETHRLLNDAFAIGRDAVVMADADARLVDANPAFCRLVGASSDLLRGQLLTDHLQLPLPTTPSPAPGASWRGEGELGDAAGGRIRVDVTWRAVTHDSPGLARFLVTLVDLSGQQQADAQLDHLAHTDPVTDLPNRAALERQLAQQLASGEPFALMYIDMAGLKDVNESFGHDAGDLLLRSTAARLLGAVPRDGFLCRWGGDKFVLVLGAGSGETEVRSGAQSVIAAMGTPVQLGANEVGVTLNIGAAMTPQHATSAAELLHKADMASQAAGRRGRNHLAFSDGTQDHATQRRVLMQSLLRQSAKRNDFNFVAQPKVDRSGRSVGSELLMRWTTPAFGPVSPVEFIPLAEQIGLIGLLGHHAIHAAAHLAARGARLGLALPVAVNLSPKQLLQPGLDRQLLLACKVAGIAPALLELELTESALVDNLDAIKPLLQRLRQHGFSLALDDFGTGYSSLSYLRHLPFHKIKIDRSFVIDIERDPRATVLLGHIVQLCGALGMSTVAEGVETRAQFEMLCELGVQEFQGYHFARPMAEGDWVALMAAEPGVAPLLPRA